MITLTRREARRLRAVFRRHALGITHRGPVPPLVLSADPAGLRVRHHQPHLAVEGTVPGRGDPGQTLALPLDALAALEGRDEEPVTLEATSPRRTIARMHERGIPQVREFDVPELDSLPAFPAPPTSFAEVPSAFLDALAQATASTADDATRYALDCLLLQGDTGQVVATDGRQILVQGGFTLPWAGDVLVRRTRLFASRVWPRDDAAAAGKNRHACRAPDRHLDGFLTIQADARFPRIDGVLPDDSAVTTRLQLDPKDVVFLTTALDRLPGDAEHNAPLTLDCNGSIAVRGAGPRPAA